MERKTPEELEAMTDEGLVCYNQGLMAEKEAIAAHQLEVKGEQHRRAAMGKLAGLTEEQKVALAEQILAAKAG